MSNRIKIAVVGLGKMGLSHFSMVNAHPDVEAVACDTSGFWVDVLSKNTKASYYKDYTKMLDEAGLDAVVIATPSRAHDPMVRAALEKGLHVFCEKPFSLNWEEALRLADMAEDKGLVNQVGYHYRYVGAFREMKRLLDAGAIGTVTHVLAEAYGPVVLRENKKSWRTQKSEGGGCLYDYAAHPLNLLNWYFGEPARVSGSVLNSIYSKDIDDEVFSTLQFDGGPTAQLTVNWSDESHRKMTTRISMIGTNGRLYADRQECQLYLRQPIEGLEDYIKGWNVKYTTELTENAWFYLRGEEYSNQLDDFICAVRDGKSASPENSFRSAAMTDKCIALIQADHEAAAEVLKPKIAAEPTASKRGWFGRK